MDAIHTERLVLRRLHTDDAPWILELVNDPDWLRHIGDRNVHTLDDARDFLLRGPIAMYARHGFGLLAVELREGRAPLGICGLLRREALPDVDVGFAFLPRHRGRGYAHEAAAATLDFGRRSLGLARIVAVASPGNEASFRVLRKLGLREEGTVRLEDGGEGLLLFGPAPGEA